MIFVRFAGTLKSYQGVFKFSKSISRFTGMLNHHIKDINPQ
jgi:hypothetical protein